MQRTALLCGTPGLFQPPFLLTGSPKAWLDSQTGSRGTVCDGSVICFTSTVHGRILENGIDKCSHQMSWPHQTDALLSRATSRLSVYLLKTVEKSSPSPETIQKEGEAPVRPIF